MERTKRAAYVEAHRAWMDAMEAYIDANHSIGLGKLQPAGAEAAAIDILKGSLAVQKANRVLLAAEKEWLREGADITLALHVGPMEALQDALREGLDTHTDLG